MYATVRRYRGIGSSGGQFAPRVSEGFVPILHQSQGFVAYCAFAGEEGDAYSVGVFETRQAGEAAGARAREWVRANLGDLVRDAPEVTQGEVLNQDLTGIRAGAGGNVHVRLSRFGGIRHTGDEIRRRAEREVMPLIRAQEGFLGFLNFLAEGDPGLGVSVGFWRSREAAGAWRERFAREVAPKLADLLPNPPEATSGDSLVLAAAWAAERSPGA
jgi:heme-degrading monooxygenase HmoA